MAEPVVILFDPVDEQSARYLRACREGWGLRTVAVMTTRRSPSFLGAPHHSDLAGLAGVYRSSLTDLAQTARSIASRHTVVAVIPQAELQVVPAAQLAQELGLDWLPVATAQRFRDKAALKEHLRGVPQGPRINASRLVKAVSEVRDAVDDFGLTRFVLKPNDGMGNSRIGFFSRSNTDAELQTYLMGKPAVVLEEFLDGREFCVNGQVDADGRAQVLSVFRTHHVTANGRPQLASSFELVRHRDDDFAITADYACSVVEAAGLRSSPFHLELIVDDDGPCLVEVAARMAGAGMGEDTNRAHGGALDVFELAAQHYIGLPAQRTHHANWQAYDDVARRTICGISDRTQVVTRIDGLDEVESMPEFDHWVLPPRLGRRVHRTESLLTIPWQATLTGTSQDQLESAEAVIRSRLRINSPAAVSTIARGYLSAIKARADRHSIAYVTAGGVEQ